MGKILIVDDSVTVRTEVSNFLSSNGFEVITACDGIDGLDKIRNNGALSLVICDVNMPNMDGLTMVENVRRQLNNNVQIIMLTTECDQRLKARGKAAGVKGWIVKPFNGPSSLDAIKRLAT